MTRKLHDCARCSLRAMTMPDCPECRGVGQYWAEAERNYGFTPRDATAVMIRRPDATPRQVARIRELYARGWSAPELAAAFGQTVGATKRLLA
ncbi:MAG: hypothetical protein IMF05_03705 [Proteobacteria bacterium]|nr:hypothetical protein [Pseudomonadota bacterium]